MEGLLCNIYKRYNQFDNQKNVITVQNQYTMIKIYREGKSNLVDIETQIGKIESQRILDSIDSSQGFLLESHFIQPKSMIIRVYLLEIIARSIPKSFYDRINYNADSIIELTMAITLYYIGFQTYKFSDMKLPETQKKNIIGRTDFYFGIQELEKVRGKTNREELEKYLALFSKDVDKVQETDTLGLYMDKENAFIICIDEYLDYIIFELESIFFSSSTKEEYSEYIETKGNAFENLVHGITRNFVEKSYHTLYYYPNGNQKIELDVLLKDGDDIALLECKSGTFNTFGIDKDEILKLKIQNKTKKAYKSLKTVLKYIEKSGEYCFKCQQGKILGNSSNPIAIHVSMYPMDFISSNMHALFPQYYEVNNPILTISIEHLFAILLDSNINKRNIFSYWKLRKNDILKFPKMYFDINELDLYYQINKEENTILAELKNNNVLSGMNPDLKIISTFTNQFGDEVRPASNAIKMLDSFLLGGVFEHGKKSFGINKRYLKSLRDYLREDAL